MAKGYTCVGSIRGDCGVLHRTLSGAVACLWRDRQGCASQGGYSDRSIRHADGTPLDDDEIEAVEEML